MISSYDEFKEELESFIIFRSKNYVNTDCNISMLVDIVWDEITSDINVMWEVEDVLIDGTQRIYDIASMVADTDGKVLKYYKDITSIVSDEFVDIDLFFDVLEGNQIQINDTNFLADQDGRTIQLMRRVVPAIEILGLEMYGMVRNALVEGVMYHIETSVPSQQDSQVANLQYVRYFNARKQLKEHLPQYKTFDSRNTGSQQKRTMI